MLQDVFPDKATERKILSLIIKCPSDGCGWTGELRNKEVALLIQIPLIIRNMQLFIHYPCAVVGFSQNKLWKSPSLVLFYSFDRFTQNHVLSCSWCVTIFPVEQKCKENILNNTNFLSVPGESFTVNTVASPTQNAKCR